MDGFRWDGKPLDKGALRLVLALRNLAGEVE
jgi:hypothetical protein